MSNPRQIPNTPDAPNTPETPDAPYTIRIDERAIKHVGNQVELLTQVSPSRGMGLGYLIEMAGGKSIARIEAPKTNARLPQLGIRCVAAAREHTIHMLLATTHLHRHLCELEVIGHRTGKIPPLSTTSERWTYDGDRGTTCALVRTGPPWRAGIWEDQDVAFDALGVPQALSWLKKEKNMRWLGIATLHDEPEPLVLETGGILITAIVGIGNDVPDDHWSGDREQVQAIAQAAWMTPRRS